MTAAAEEDRESGEGAAAQPSLLQSLQGLWRELPGLINDRVDLLALELERAGMALMQIVALVVVAAILAVTAWIALWGAVVALLISLKLHWGLAALLVLLVNLGSAWWAVSRIRSLVPMLQLSATRRHMTLGASREPDPDPADPPAPPYAGNATGHVVAP
jgi:uncharacterized membrane protein YqjE